MFKTLQTEVPILSLFFLDLIIQIPRKAETGGNTFSKLRLVGTDQFLRKQLRNMAMIKKIKTYYYLINFFYQKSLKF
jgi:hypothetical protein